MTHLIETWHSSFLKEILKQTLSKFYIYNKIYYVCDAIMKHVVPKDLLTSKTAKLCHTMNLFILVSILLVVGAFLATIGEATSNAAEPESEPPTS